MKIALAATFIALVLSLVPRDAFALPSPFQVAQEANHAEVQTLTAWLSAHGCPNYAVDFVESANAKNLDFRTLVPIWVIESGCGKHELYSNGFGFEPSGSLKHFTSTQEAIAYVSQQLANGRPYAGKTLKEKVTTYNSVNPKYWSKYISIFNSIHK